MLKPRLVARMLSISMMVVGAGAINGQEFPTRPVRIVTGGVGGGSDFVARLIAPGISGPLGQPVIVDNRPSGLIPAVTMVSSSPDGHTLLLDGSSVYIRTLLQKTPYEPLKDFSFVTSVDRSCNVLVVHSSLPVKSVKELIAVAKSKPGVLNYATGTVGGPEHLAGELFNAMADVKITNIFYKGGGGPATLGLLTGEVQVYFGPISTVLPQIKAGKIVAIGVTSPQPTARVPGVPTIAETLPGYESLSITGIYAPAKTPAAAINRLNREIVRVLNTSEIKEKFLNVGLESAPSSPEELAAMTKANLVKWAKVIKDAGIKVE